MKQGASNSNIPNGSPKPSLQSNFRVMFHFHQRACSHPSLAFYDFHLMPEIRNPVAKRNPPILKTNKEGHLRKRNWLFLIYQMKCQINTMRWQCTCGEEIEGIGPGEVEERLSTADKQCEAFKKRKNMRSRENKHSSEERSEEGTLILLMCISHCETSLSKYIWHMCTRLERDKQIIYRRNTHSRGNQRRRRER